MLLEYYYTERQTELKLKQLRSNKEDLLERIDFLECGVIVFPSLMDFYLLIKTKKINTDIFVILKKN